MIIQLKDSKVVKILDGFKGHGGCPTCDYGSCYITKLMFIFDDGDELNVSYGQEYECPFSVASIVRVIDRHMGKFKDMTKEEFKIFWKTMQNMQNAEDENNEHQAFYSELVREYNSGIVREYRGY